MTILQPTVDTLQSQFEVKDYQIEQSASALVAAQAFHAGTIHQQLLSGKAGTAH